MIYIILYIIGVFLTAAISTRYFDTLTNDAVCFGLVWPIFIPLYIFLSLIAFVADYAKKGKFIK